MARPLDAMSRLERHHHLLRQGFRSDADALLSAHQFLRVQDEQSDSWEIRLARSYYAQLHREYALADMARYKEGAIGLRWRTEQEVFDGKGQFTCGNKACSTSDASLQSFELLFAYVEQGEQKQALVKLRVCSKCEEKLHYREHKDQRRQRRHERRRHDRSARDEPQDREGSARSTDKAHRHSGERRHGKRKRHCRHGRSRSRSCSRSRSRSRDHEPKRDHERASSGASASAGSHIPPQSAGGGGAREKQPQLDGGQHLSEDAATFERYCKDLLL